MKRIPLRARDGSVRAHALVDDADFEWLSQWRWSLCSDGSATRSTRTGGRGGPQRSFKMHRQIMGFPPGEVDHEDRNRLNNRRSNLRVATRRQNAQNVAAHRDSSSGHRGVTWNEPTENWRASVCLDGRRHYLGLHGDIAGAAAAASAFRAAHMPFSADARAAS